jgi:hypothetical protein
MSEINNTLDKHTNRIYFKQHKIYQTAVPNTTDYTWRVTTTSSEQLPRNIFVVFQQHAQRGNQQQNNAIFNHADVRRIHARLNSRQYPERAIECNFSDDANKNITRPYMYLLDAMQKYQDVEDGTQISAEEFRTLYPIFHFDVSKHHERVVDSTADIEITWTLGAVPIAPLYVYALVISDRFFTIDSIGGKMTVQV